MGATFIKRGKTFRVLVHQGGDRATLTVRTKADAEGVCKEIRRRELAGENVVQALRQARAPVIPTRTMPTLEEALTAFIESQVRAGELRESTSANYRSRCRKWLFPALGRVPIDKVTREQIGGVIRTIREAGMSSGIRRGVVNPLRMFYQHMIETKQLPGPNPCADLKWFQGRAKPKATDVPYFTPTEGAKVLEAMKVLHPRWHAFTMTAFLAGLRWGECAALYRDDLERGMLAVERTVSGSRVAAPKTNKTRYVKVTPALLAALRGHMEAMELEAQVGQWSPEARRLMFPTVRGNIVSYKYFLKEVWVPTLAAAKVVRRRFHSTRHSYAAWMLSSGADPRYVADQLGHAQVTLTMNTYGKHIVRRDHEHVVIALDRLLAE